METARKLQADEYSRRLGELNHAHEEAKRILDTYVPQTVYDAEHSKYDERHIVTDKRLNAHDLLFAELKGRIAAYSISVLIIWALFQYFWKK